MATTKKTARTHTKSGIVAMVSEKQGRMIFEAVKRHLQSHAAKYLKDEDHSLHVILDGHRIPINNSRENIALAGLLLNSCGVSSLSSSAQSGIQRLMVHAQQQAGNVHLRRFSALSEDHSRLYVPTDDGRLLCISAQEIQTCANGQNQDSFWLEHPEHAPLKYVQADPAPGLAMFERLLVDTQACREPGMQWFVGMNMGLFPYVRDCCPNRLIQVSNGRSQSGKTSGGQRFTLFHGLGEVKGDYTVASLGNLLDIGLLVMDNKEQANLNQQFIDYLLSLATGSQRCRSFADGTLRVSRGRPVGVITSIEGMSKKELQKRCVEVTYQVVGEYLSRSQTEAEIQKHRHVISSALVQVLQRYLRVRNEARPWPNPIPEFEEHFRALCDLLTAYGEVARKPSGWADSIIAEWDRVLREREPDENEMEQPILRILDEVSSGAVECDCQQHKITWHAQPGTLYVTTCEGLLTMLQRLKLPDRKFPQNAIGLSRRLRDAEFRAFTVLTPEIAPDVGVLRRKGNKRPIGLFVPDDEMTIRDEAA